MAAEPCLRVLLHENNAQITTGTSAYSLLSKDLQLTRDYGNSKSVTRYHILLHIK